MFGKNQQMYDDEAGAMQSLAQWLFARHSCLLTGMDVWKICQLSGAADTNI
jgi:hypothetical protein